MAKSKILMPFIVKWEGGYANHPNDKGGCTMKGVTIGTFREFFGKDKTCGDLKNIDDNQWLTIFEKGFWDPCKGNEIENQSIANIIIDWAWHSGPKTVIKKIQKIVGVKDDGIMGPITISAINAMEQSELFEIIYKTRAEYYINICKKNSSQKVFLKGWLNRLADFIFAEEEKPTPTEEIKHEEMVKETYEETKKHFTDIMSELGGSFLYK